MTTQWVCATSHQSREKWAKRELENQNFEVYLPMCVADWAREPRIRPFLPGYLFVHVDFDDRNNRWRAVYSTLGVKSVISSGDRPQPIADWIIEEIKSREIDGLVRLPPKAQCRYNKGDRVFLRGSPMEAVFDEAKDHKRATIFISLLGKQHRPIVPLSRLTTSAALAASG